MSDENEPIVKVTRAGTVKVSATATWIFRVTILGMFSVIIWAMTNGIDTFIRYATPQINAAVSNSIPIVVPQVIAGIEPTIEMQTRKLTGDVHDRLVREFIRRDIHDLQLDQIKQSIILETAERKDTDKATELVLREIQKEQQAMSRLLDNIATKVGARKGGQP